MPKISVIVPTKNRPYRLVDALRSLENQIYKDFEVIIVNDGGTSVKNIADDYSRTLDIRLYENTTSIGVSAARNHAVSNSRGEYLAFLDDDDYYLPRHIGNLVHELSSFDFVYTSTYVSDTRVSSLPLNADNGTFITNDFDSLFLLVTCYIPVVSVGCRNFRSVAKFDERLGACEDWKMWLSLLTEHNFTARHLSEVDTVFHKETDINNVSFNARVELSHYDMFTQAWEEVVKEFPTSDSRVQEAREYMRLFQRLARSHLEEAATLNNFYYINSTHYMLNCFKTRSWSADFSKVISQYLKV